MFIKMLLSSTLMGLCSAVFAKKNNLKPYFWFLMGFLFGCFSLIALFFISYHSKRQKTKKTPSSTTIEIPDSRLWYYLSEHKQQNGPMSTTKLFSLYQTKTVTENTFVWNETLENWIKLQNSDIFTKFFAKKPNR